MRHPAESIQRIGSEASADHHHSSGRDHGDGRRHLADEQVSRLAVIANAHALGHRIANMEHDFGSPVRANRLRACAASLLDMPQTIDEPAKTGHRPTRNVAHAPFTIIRRMNNRRAWLISSISALTLCLTLGTTASQVAQGSLERMLQGDLARFPAKTAIYVKHLTTGQEAAVRADEAFNSASVIKIPIMVLAYQLAEQGKLKLDARVTMNRGDVRGGSGILRYHDLGLQPTVRDLITQMIITSDNTATDMMITQVGGVDAVNQWLKTNSYSELKLNTTIYEVFKRRYAFADAALDSLTPEEVYAAQTGDPSFASMSQSRFDEVQKTMQRPGLSAELNRQVSEEPSTWLGQITARGVGRILAAIEQCTVLTKPSCAEMNRAFRRQQSGARRLPHFLDVAVGHKTGDFPPMLANDVGIIYSRSGPIVVSFLTNGIREPYAELEDRMGRTARSIVDFFDGPR